MVEVEHIMRIHGHEVTVKSMKQKPRQNEGRRFKKFSSVATKRREHGDGANRASCPVSKCRWSIGDRLHHWRWWSRRQYAFRPHLARSGWWKIPQSSKLYESTRPCNVKHIRIYIYILRIFIKRVYIHYKLCIMCI